MRTQHPGQERPRRPSDSSRSPQKLQFKLESKIFQFKLESKIFQFKLESKNSWNWQNRLWSSAAKVFHVTIRQSSVTFIAAPSLDHRSTWANTDVQPLTNQHTEQQKTNRSNRSTYRGSQTVPTKTENKRLLVASTFLPLRWLLRWLSA